MRTNTSIHDFLTEKLIFESSILEIGSGAGTVKLSKLFQSIDAIEHDYKYLNMASTVNYIHAPLVPYTDSYFREATLWYNEKILAKSLQPCYDAIIIDGPQGNYGRGGFYTNIDLFKAKYYVFDDTHRLWDFRLAGRVADYFKVPFTTYTDGKRWFSVVTTKE